MSNSAKLEDLSQWILYEGLRGQLSKEEYYATSIAIAFAYHTALVEFGDEAYNFNLDLVLNKINDREIKSFLTRKLNGIDISKSATILIFGIEGLEDYILGVEDAISYSRYANTPRSVLAIVGKILNINEGEEILSVGQDIGNLVSLNSNVDKKLVYTYTDSNVDVVAIVKIRLEILSRKKGFNTLQSIVLNQDVLQLKLEKKYDKVFSHMPFSIRMSSHEYNQFKESTPILNAFKKPSTLDWPYMIKLIQSIKESGKAISLAGMGTTYNLNDRVFRQYFIEKGYIEAIISLPGKLLNESAVQSVLYIFSNNNKIVKMIDATEICEVGRRQNSLSDENIKTILAAYSSEIEGVSRNVSVKEIANNDYALIPNRYFSSISYSNGVAFKELVSIRRGASLRAEALDEITSIDHTDYQYLMLADITDGIIAEDLTYITHIDESLNNFIIREDNLVLSKIGAPFKVAIMDKRDTSIIANGNLYILEVDKAKVDPHYLQAFLQSDEGQKLLTSVAKGATFATISIKDLSELEIPLPSLTEQKIKGKIYQEALNDIILLSNKLAKTKTKISSLFDNKRVKTDAE